MKSRMKWILLTALLIALCAFSASTFIQQSVHAQDERAQSVMPSGQGCCDRVSAEGTGSLNASGAFVVDAEFSRP